jgi:hypothetical protein
LKQEHHSQQNETRFHETCIIISLKKSKNREFDKELLQFNLRQERAEKQGGGGEGVNTATKHYTMNTCNRHPDWVGNA